MSAMSGLGALAAGAADHELLHVVTTGIEDGVRAPHVRIARLDVGTLASVGVPGATVDGERAVGPVFTAPLTLGGRDVGTLELDGRTPGERYPGWGKGMLRAMAPQLAAEIHALSLTAELAHQRDAVLEATARERERLRGDLHDGLGSLTGVGLGLAALRDVVSGELARLVPVLERKVAASVTEIRRILDGLLPEALVRHGLAHVLPVRPAGCFRGRRQWLPRSSRRRGWAGIHAGQGHQGHSY
ncbi:signal transduction histidine kinase [Arthrobacter sp. UYCu511]|uniref:histidine kinase n=1 Tax=Arthrobacter sp. UYCu511 TaxID=3156337 RepID=UPI003391F78B